MKQVVSRACWTQIRTELRVTVPATYFGKTNSSCAPSEVPSARRCCRASRGAPAFLPSLAGCFTGQTPTSAGHFVVAWSKHHWNCSKGRGVAEFGVLLGIVCSCLLVPAALRVFWAVGLHLAGRVGLNERSFRLRQTRAKKTTDLTLLEIILLPHIQSCNSPLESKPAAACRRGK